MINYKEPCFEAYISLDIPEPINSDVYETREAFSDKKMTVMPVDIPLFGHFDGKMTLIRNAGELEALMDLVMNDIALMDFGSDNHKLSASHYEVSEGKLYLRFERNDLIVALLKAVIHRIKAGEYPCFNDLDILNLNVDALEYHDMYVVTKTHLPLEEMNKYHNQMVHLDVEIERITFYHKEAVPLTRVKSWTIKSCE